MASAISVENTKIPMMAFQGELVSFSLLSVNGRPISVSFFLFYLMLLCMFSFSMKVSRARSLAVLNAYTSIDANRDILI